MEKPEGIRKLEGVKKREIHEREGTVGKDPNLPPQEWTKRPPVGCDVKDIDIFLGEDGLYHWRFVRDPKKITGTKERKEHDDYEKEKKLWTEGL
ncbi:MAG: hypothetical protein UV58_C0006G0028 [Candidatus Wolfebacteria bacterium GW2011_GWC1_43_10]|uniref:Uncharacterized protein n=2 Tax=Candidatus Wolfeibacteriota TaxID=1752735 RepID=A0A0G1CBF4_9BACT|nr:MAG: hypothetical protein UV58_C0006G0028 [Candidatus Wolfebacteria bacterium GW2011_GWC1_43_10]KKT22934.1 MAG: hypothetical protein UW08_C0002G0063 [Parcubacteria group bacterium GW2011_GWB1_43_8b]OGM89955.1 MAG: hypothetical protein A2108_02255 [Candidatus Wolfebacteria bacterium GWA1_42_9]